MVEIARETQLQFFMGPGGVGKTSVSASYAVSLAEKGSKVLLVSLDPAKRLSTILGIADPKEVKEHPLFKNLFCVQQDTDTLLKTAILNFSKPEQAHNVFQHPFYKVLRSGISGPTEYMSLFSLYKWWKSGAYDYIVVDTAPHVHAVRVLKMPNVIKAFQENGVFKKMILPLAKVSGIGVGIVQGVVGKISTNLFGIHLFKDLAAFMLLMEDTIRGFYDLSGEFQELIKGDLSSFIFVGTPYDQSVFVFDRLSEDLDELGAEFSQIFLNKTISRDLESTEKAETFFGKMLVQQNRVYTQLKKKSDCVWSLPTICDSGFSPLEIVKTLAKDISETT